MNLFFRLLKSIKQYFLRPNYHTFQLLNRSKLPIFLPLYKTFNLISLFLHFIFDRFFWMKTFVLKNIHSTLHETIINFLLDKVINFIIIYLLIIQCCKYWFCMLLWLKVCRVRTHCWFWIFWLVRDKKREVWSWSLGFIMKHALTVGIKL